jgi:hypothetical protein
MAKENEMFICWHGLLFIGEFRGCLIALAFLK